MLSTKTQPLAAAWTIRNFSQAGGVVQFFLRDEKHKNTHFVISFCGRSAVALVLGPVSVLDLVGDIANLVPRDFSRPAPKPGKSPWKRGWDITIALCSCRRFFMFFMFLFKIRILFQIARLPQNFDNFCWFGWGESAISRRTLTTIILPLKKACDAGLISCSHIGFRRQNDK